MSTKHDSVPPGRKARPKVDELPVARGPFSHFGAFEPMIRGIRDERPLDMTAEAWHASHPGEPFSKWSAMARQHVLDHLGMHAGPVNLQATTLEKVDRGSYTLEHIEFNVASWARVPGCLLLPKSDKPLPAIVLCHAWGGPMIWGRQRMVDTGRDHPLLVEHRDKCYGGAFLADMFAQNGFAVVVIDSLHFGQRIPYGFDGVPLQFDPFELSVEEAEQMCHRVARSVALTGHEFAWAGSTWAGVVFTEDRACIDYLLGRPEVDGERIGVTGLSGGAWRTNMLAALDTRIRASVSACWMTTGDYQQAYRSVVGSGVFTDMPGVWDRLDVPDLAIMTAPRAAMLFINRRDHLFCEEAQDEAIRQIRAGFEWASCPEQLGIESPLKPHCYDADLQKLAVAWFKKHLRG